MYASQPESKPFSYNVAQNTGIILSPKKEVDIYGRGTGKSSKFAWKLKQVQELMPRSTSAISGETYQQILTRTLPATVEALERIGYHQDLDYFIGKRPPEKFGFQYPYQRPQDFDRFLIFKNGAGFHLTSQDREGKARGYNLSFILADELLTQDKKRLENEVMMGNRGGDDKFGHCYLNHGWHLASSMPNSAKSAWILDYSNYYQEDGKPIWLLWNKMCQLQLKFMQSKIVEEQLELLREIRKLRKSITFYPNKDGILFSLGNVFDNLGIGVQFDYIKSSYQQMSTLSFRIEMLNERMNSVEQSFYKINEDKHLYTHYDYGYLDGLEYNIEKLKNIDSRQDADVDKNRPLDMGIDFGAEINAIRIAQPHAVDFKGRESNEYRFVKSIYVKYPEGLKDAAIKFARYYQYHNKKEINLPYDHTAVGRDPVRQKFIEELIKYLTELGWKVNSVYIGQTTNPHTRFLLWEVLLRGDDTRFSKILFNRTNDWDGILSMQLAGVKQGKNGFVKDKASEQSSTIPREQATDLSDAADTLVVWRFLSKMDSKAGGFEVYM